MLTPAICTQCGANIEVDASCEAGICKFCGTAFITEKVINNYVTNHSTVHNVTENVTKIIYGNEKDEGEDFFKRGATLLKISKFKEARKAFKKACALSPEKAVYWFYLATTYTDNFKSINRCFDTGADSSEYGLEPCLEALNSFFALATDEEIATLSDEFGINLAGGPSFVLAKLIENVDSSDASTAYTLTSALCLLPNNKLIKTAETANAFASLILRTNLECYTYAAEIYNICSEYIDSEMRSRLKEKLGDSENKVYNGIIDITNFALLKDGEYADGVLAIRRPEVKSICTPHDFLVNKLIITENITEPMFRIKANVVEFEGSVSDKIIINAITHIAQKIVVLPPSCTSLYYDADVKYAQVPGSLIIYSKGKFNNGIVFKTYRSNGHDEIFKFGSVIDGKITYPNTELPLRAFNENLLEYFEDDIKSGKLVGYSENPKPASSGGCYVATCVYGSYDCPQVWTLRRYRDQKLSGTLFGRLFIKLYYAISPKIVQMFGKTVWFNRFFRKRLDKMVYKLEKEGFENTPYID